VCVLSLYSLFISTLNIPTWYSGSGLPTVNKSPVELYVPTPHISVSPTPSLTVTFEPLSFSF